MNSREYKVLLVLCVMVAVSSIWVLVSYNGVFSGAFKTLYLVNSALFIVAVFFAVQLGSQQVGVGN